MPPARAAWIASGESGSETVRTDTWEPSALASASPCSTPLSASSEPSVAIRMCLYIGDLRLDLAPERWAGARLAGSGSSVQRSRYARKALGRSFAPPHQLAPHDSLDDAHAFGAVVECRYVSELLAAVVHEDLAVL